MKKDQNLPNKIFHNHNSSRKPLPDNYNNYRQQSTYRITVTEDLLIEDNH